MPYRDDFEATKEKLEALEIELRAVRTRTEELSALHRSEAALEREVAALRTKIDRMTAKRALPLLERVRIASPCKAKWDEMLGDDRVRFCGSCQKNVYNLSEMPREEAERFVRDQGGGACVRLYRRMDGTVMTADCPIGRKRKRLRNVVLATTSSGMLAAGALFSWTATRSTASETMGTITMGKPAETPIPVTQGVWAMGATSPMKQETTLPDASGHGLALQPHQQKSPSDKSNLHMQMGRR